MSITYMNAKEQTYYLHQGTTKVGKATYYFSRKREGHLVESIPLGFEIYEHPNGQVVLRKIPPKIITDEERQIVEESMRDVVGISDCKIDVKDKTIIIYTADQDEHDLSQLFEEVSPVLSENLQLMTLLHQTMPYVPRWRFLLANAPGRLFVTQRYCILGSVSKWHDIGEVDTLARLVKQYIESNIL